MIYGKDGSLSNGAGTRRIASMPSTRRIDPAKASPIYINTLYICDDRLDVAVLFALERVPDRALNSALSRRSLGFTSLARSLSVLRRLCRLPSNVAHESTDSSWPRSHV